MRSSCFSFSGRKHDSAALMFYKKQKKMFRCSLGTRLSFFPLLAQVGFFNPMSPHFDWILAVCQQQDGDASSHVLETREANSLFFLLHAKIRRLDFRRNMFWVFSFQNGRLRTRRTEFMKSCAPCINTR